MFLIRYICIVAIFTGLNSNLFGQSLSPLKPGDQVPDLSIGNVTNYKGEKLNIKDFKGRWLLIDFWGAGCIGCVGSFAMIDSMQRKYDGKLQVLLVSKNNQKQLDAFVNGLRKKVNLPNVPRISSDNTLEKLFPYVAVPHHVWIDPDGRFYSATSASNFTPRNIDRLLAGEKPYFKPYVHGRYKNYTAASLIETATGAEQGLRSLYSYFTGYVYKGANNGYENHRLDSVNNLTRFTLSNVSLTNLAHKIIPYTNTEDTYLFRNRIFYEFDTPPVLAEPEDDALAEEWKKKNLYSYEIQYPMDMNLVNSAKKIREDILEYLKSFAGISVYEDRRKIKVIKVRTSDGGKGIQAKDSELEYKLFPKIQKTYFKLFFWKPIQTYYAARNIFFELDFKEPSFPVTIDVGDNWRNLDSLKAILAPQGIDLVEEEKLDNVLVISEKAQSRP